MPEWLFDCGSCSRNDVRQASEPILKYIKGANGVVASVECCRECAEKWTMIEQQERAKEHAEKKKRRPVSVAQRLTRKASAQPEEQPEEASTSPGTAG